MADPATRRKIIRYALFIAALSLAVIMVARVAEMMLEHQDASPPAAAP